MSARCHILTCLIRVTCSYLQAHDLIRGITGYGEGNGPYIVIHDGFNLEVWANFPKGADRMVLDHHPYLAFDGQPNTAPVVTDDGLGEPGGTWPTQACAWGTQINSRSDFLCSFRLKQTLTDLLLVNSPLE